MKKIIVQIWDTAGQERYKSVTRIFYQQSQAILLVYDITQKETFEALKKLYEEIKEIIDIKKVYIFIVGNKNDLYKDEQVDKKEAEDFTYSVNGTYRCVSAFSSNGIKELFECVGKTVLLDKNKIFKSEEKILEDNKSYKLTKKNKTKNTKGKKKKKFC